MSTQSPGKVLFFITSKAETLKIVNSFLSKRNFVVHIETDIKDAIVRVFELKPDFIFVEWDNPDKKAAHLPKLLGQSTASVIVPYITKNTKDAIFKFGNCPYTPKLYPPVSGPAVERLVLKSDKDDAESLARINRFKNQKANQEEILKLQQSLSESSDTEVNEISTTAESTASVRGVRIHMPEENIDGVPYNLDEMRTEIEHRNDVLSQPKSPLSSNQIKGLRSTMQEKVKEPLESMISTINSSGTAQNQAKKKSNLIFQKGVSSPGKTQIIIQQGTPNSVDKNKKKFKVYCIALVSDAWCGYFIISTQAPLDFASIDLVFNDWIRLQFDNIFDLTEKDYFEFDDVDTKILSEIQKMSDYSEEMKVADYEMRVSFFSVEPSDMRIDFNEEKNYIQLFTRDVPSDVEIDFNLLLHLPENQKYLLYTQTNKALSDDQKNRLLSKNITQLYTSVNYEHEYRKFLVNKTFSRLHEMINSRLSVV